MMSFLFCIKWYETFASWFTESNWGKTGSIPSMDEYLETGMTSVATHTIVLPASCLLNPSLPISKLRPEQYESTTKLLMVIARLLNDVQSYRVTLYFDFLLSCFRSTSQELIVMI
jgi:geranyllinalool synthase